MRIAYCKAKAYNLPTAEQVKELKTYCRGEWYYIHCQYALHLTGPNDNSIYLDEYEYESPAIFWIKQSEGSRFNAFKLLWDVSVYSNDAYLPLVDELGYSHGVMLVKNKQDI